VIGYLDCYSGISGNMLLGALVDAGVRPDDLTDAVASLAIEGFERLEARTVERGGLRATHVEVCTRPEPEHHRPFRAVVEMLERASLNPAVRRGSLAVLRRLAEAEGLIHGVARDEVELHEVGAVDSIVDVVGSVAGLQLLGVDRLGASPLPAAPGQISGGHHAALPGPAPATLALLAAAGAPLRPFGDGRELVTPTGAALVAELATFGVPPMRLRRVGYGAGSAQLPWPNVMRLWLGDPVETAVGADDETHVVLETNLDDMSPQLLAPVSDLLFAAGALDVSFAPLAMKKNRAGTLVSVIAPAECEATLADLLLRETTTLGVRVHAVRRHEADREIRSLDTRYGPVEVKLKLLGGRVVGAAPEFESVRAVSRTSGAPLGSVHAAAAAAALDLVDASAAIED
jgi:pyridinium-3,5-bisthiocarboxylic acid mononucleotide nickel chelatase